MSESSKKNYTVSFDILRLIAAFFVILQHVTAYSLLLDGQTLTSPSYQGLLLVNTLTHCAVPVFILISGALFLGTPRGEDPKRMLRHNTLRILILFAFWEVFYTCLHYDFPLFTLKSFLFALFVIPYHFWYFPMLIGLYLLVPLLYRFVHSCDETLLRYFIGLFFVMELGWKTLQAIPHFYVAGQALSLRSSILDFGFIGYFILGYLLTTRDLSKKTVRLITILGFLSIPAGYFFCAWNTIRSQALDVSPVDAFTLFNAFVSILLFYGIFRLFGRIPFSEKAAKFFRNLGKDTLGIYILHLALFEILLKTRLGQSLQTCNIMLSLGVSFGIFLACGLVSALLRRIPYIGRYLA